MEVNEPGVVIDDLEVTYRDEGKTQWRVTFERIVSHLPDGRSMTQDEMEEMQQAAAANAEMFDPEGA